MTVFLKLAVGECILFSPQTVTQTLQNDGILFNDAYLSVVTNHGLPSPTYVCKGRTYEEGDMIEVKISAFYAQIDVK